MNNNCNQNQHFESLESVNLEVRECFNSIYRLLHELKEGYHDEDVAVEKTKTNQFQEQLELKLVKTTHGDECMNINVIGNKLESLETVHLEVRGCFNAIYQLLAELKKGYSDDNLVVDLPVETSLLQRQRYKLFVWLQFIYKRAKIGEEAKCSLECRKSLSIFSNLVVYRLCKIKQLIPNFKYFRRRLYTVGLLWIYGSDL